MLAYFQVFHTTRSHFVPILVAQPAPEQLHQQTTTQNAERQTAPNAERRTLHSVPFGLQFIYEPVVFMNILYAAVA